MSLAALSFPMVVLALFLGTACLASTGLLALWHRVLRVRPALAGRTPLIAALPWLAGLAVALGAVLPGDPHLGQALACHCLESMPAWLHLCPVHPEEAATLALPAAALLLWLAPGRLRALGELRREPRGAGGGDQPRVLALGAPMALLHGWLRPTLVVDRSLWGALSTEERDAVLAHERGHLRRRDPLVRVLLRALLVIAPRRAATATTQAWLDHAELQADAEAARRLSDPALVARTLLRCARLGARAPDLAVAWTGGRLERRVRALVESGGASAPARSDLGLGDVAVLAALGAAALGATPWIHHQVEHLLNLPL